MTVTPEAGTQIWRRTDGGWTSQKHQVAGSQYFDDRPGAAQWERDAADARQPGYTRIYDGNPPKDGQPDNGFDIVRSLDIEPAVVIAKSKPTFGEWEELPSWEK
ncbi:hypothetical protein [Nocardia fluminea]|uniref:Uncharacterized protein n=1 Tax=Nocardia fluminea TaxID=134984 RepID=A0A2N3WXX1_9NOCA|nr:hypothetical protein [Nocardia fluminea]PKV98741.1 hypothetical protein ATK86_0766 [Nocardia fluminea]